VRKGLAEERFYIKEVIIGKALGARKVDIRARGKTGEIHASKSSITVRMEEMSSSDFYKQLITGKCPPGVGSIFKRMLYSNDADFEQV